MDTQLSRPPTLAMQNLSSASRTISRINILVVEKLSIIVGEYFQNITKMQAYYMQIQTLVHYNRQLIDVLTLFQEHQRMLLGRLKLMEELNYQYLHVYCQNKGIPWSTFALPHYDSIFNQVNLQDITFDLNQTLKPPLLDLNYKNQLFQILRNCFLTSQDDLLAKIQYKLIDCTDPKQKSQLQQIKKDIQEYNLLMADKNEQKKFFDLLKIRADIRKRVEDLYDKSQNSQIKPDYHSEQNLISKIITLHANMQKMDEGAIKEYLEEEKSTRTNIEKERIVIQEQIQQKYIEFQRKAIEQQKFIQQLQDIQSKMEEQLEFEKMISSERMKQFDENYQSELKKLEFKKIELTKQVQMLRHRPGLVETGIQTQRNLSFVTWQIVKINKVADVEAIRILQQKVMALNAEISNEMFKNQEKQSEIQQVREKCQIIIMEKNQEIERIEQKMEIIKQQNIELINNQQIVQNLAVRIYQSLMLITKMDIHTAIRQKIYKINDKLQDYLKSYQRKMQWNLWNERPQFFQDFSIDANMNRNSQILNNGLKSDRLAFSHDLTNVDLLKQTIRKRQNHEQPNMWVSLMQERAQQFQYNPPKQKEVSLNLSKQLNQNDQSEYDALYKLYKQSCECLEMEQQKCKNYEIQYQRYVEKVKKKQVEDPENCSYEKQLVFLMKLAQQQQQTIQIQRKQYNQIFQQFQSGFKQKMQDQLKSLKKQALKSKSQF